MSFTSAVTSFLAVLTVAGQILAALLFLVLIFQRNFPSLFSFLSRRAILFAFIVSLAAVLGSMFYSTIVGFVPCKLCWYARIFMFPQAIILLIALLRKDSGAGIYGIVFSTAGIAITFYNYLLQIGVTSSSFCENTLCSGSCAIRYIWQFGYITMPMMALTAFLLIFAFSILSLNKNQKNIANI